VLALLTDEQQMLEEVATGLAASVGLAHPSDLDQVDRAKGWAALGDAGLLGLRARDAQGRPAGSGVDVMVVARALGGALAPVPYATSAVLAVELLALAGAPAAWIDALVAGEARYALALTPDLSGLAHIDVSGAAPAFSGGDALAWDADGASHALALSGPAPAPTVVRVALGDRWAPAASADLTRVVLRATSAPEAGDVEEGGTLDADRLNRWLALALTMVSADAVGAMRHGLLEVVEFTKQRVQYGVPVGTFQAVQHLCAEALVAVEGADSALKYAAWAVDELDPAEALLAARTAKAYCAASTRSVPETIMQVYGGIGQTWEHIAHFVNRRTLLNRQLFGDDGVQLSAIADARLGGR
jgi:alkylation response protein AidB-like acyl-CoA dehydrogenase